MTMEAAGGYAGTVYVQVAGRAVFDGSSLTILDLAPATVLFTQRPGISVGYLPTGPFLDRWYADASGAGTRVVPAVLSLLDADRESVPETRLQIGLPRIRDTGIEYWARVVSGDLPSVTGACVLFISPMVSPSTPGRGAPPEPHGRPSAA
jgi:hypothetical protein